jgi:hypothetical protein
VNRRAGALWALADEPDAAHVVGRSRDVALVFFEDVLPLRLSASPDRGALTAIAEDSGFLGNFETKTAEKQKGAAPNLSDCMASDRTSRTIMGSDR